MKRIGTWSAFACAFVAACGGGSEQVAGIDAGGSPDPVATVISSGAITGFGRLIARQGG